MCIRVRKSSRFQLYTITTEPLSGKKHGIFKVTEYWSRAFFWLRNKAASDTLKIPKNIPCNEIAVVNQIWQEFLKIAREEAGSPVVETWFKAVSCLSWDHAQKIIYLKAPNQFVKDWIVKNYHALLHVHLARLLNEHDVHIHFVDRLDNNNEKSDEVKPHIIPAKVIPGMQPVSMAMAAGHSRHSLVKNSSGSVTRAVSGQGRPGLNESHTFDTFVVGPSNSLAYAAAMAVAEKPGTLYNPFFMYGPSGLGKTHLLHALGHAIKTEHKKAVIVYQTADRFVQEFIHAIRFNKTHIFETKYKHIDVLLMDDIQFISHKEQTQEAFFHIFNTLHQAKKQIVCTSDALPADIVGLAARMRSRLEWGLVADISMPTLETKIAIVKKKAELHHESISDDIAEQIARSVTSSIRELEGALIRVLACASLTRQAITQELVYNVLFKNSSHQARQQIDLPKVVRSVMNYFNVTLAELRSERRDKQISHARHMAFYLMKKYTDKSLKEIGAFLARKDHSTVLHAFEKINFNRQNDTQLQHILHELEQTIEN
ncbi:MAG: chromosomal replication initiator protein DnaA [Candidatus Babeliaceae bacterium]|nr:chromosomal replication initiator protein DnaA [Candidatus Babeliaceae bacterium]